MIELKEKVILGFGAALGVASYFVGGFDSLLSVFFTILVIDTLTGMLKAWNLGKYESKKFRNGFLKKSGYILSILLVVQIDILCKTGGTWRNAVILFFTANEALSVIENLGELGIKFPQNFTNAIQAFNKKTKDEQSNKE